MKLELGQRRGNGGWWYKYWQIIEDNCILCFASGNENDKKKMEKDRRKTGGKKIPKNQIFLFESNTDQYACSGILIVFGPIKEIDCRAQNEHKWKLSKNANVTGFAITAICDCRSVFSVSRVGLWFGFGFGFRFRFRFGFILKYILSWFLWNGRKTTLKP